MPELPEVETLKLGLQKYLVGHIVESVELRLKKQFQGYPKDVEGAKITDVRRFGKGLVIDLSNSYSLAIHIKLTGQLIYRGKDEPKLIHTDMRTVGKTLPNNWTRVIFHLDKDATLYYNDIRQFGWIKVVPTDKVGELPFFKELGPEFFTTLDEKKFAEILSRSKTAIKPLIMDQQKMAGVGNIYANDALYLAKINPKKPANSLIAEDVKNLYKAIETVLKKGLQEGGASELTFVNALGEAGNYQNHTLVYGHQGENCSRDNATIEKYMLSGRGTYVCPVCQK